MSSANVHDIQALLDFRAALLTFAHHGKLSLDAAGTELLHVQTWLEGQLQHWTVEIRRAEEAVFVAKNELAMKKFMKIGDRPVDTTEQEKILRRAIAWLEHAEERKKNTKRWLCDLPDAVSEYQGLSRPFMDSLEHDVPRMAAWLEQKAAALEAYTQTAPPPAEGGAA
jgi:hypothetical protein